jgi:very-short-patch-repair endonuclease
MSGLQRIGAGYVPDALNRSESPIEDQLLRAFNRNRFFLLGTGNFDVDQVMAVESVYGFPNKIVVWQQHEFLGRYRSDFVLAAWRYGKTAILRAVVECDGKEFHEGISERHRDNARDRDTWDAGYAIFRFTGSAIYRHADECVAEVATAFHNLAHPFPPALLLSQREVAAS